MSTSSAPPRHASRSSLSPGVLAAIAAGAFAATLLCGGFWGAVLLLAVSKASPVLQQAGVPLGDVSILSAPLPNVAIDPDPNDWWTRRVLSQVYTAALDAVAADPQVVEQLGDDIGPDLAAEELYRRTAKGSLNPQSETIEFDIQGSKDKGTVKVVIQGAGLAGGGDGQLHISALTVILPDDSVLTVPPPTDQKLQIR